MEGEFSPFPPFSFPVSFGHISHIFPPFGPTESFRPKALFLIIFNQLQTFQDSLFAGKLSKFWCRNNNNNNNKREVDDYGYRKGRKQTERTSGVTQQLRIWERSTERYICCFGERKELYVRWYDNTRTFLWTSGID